MAENLYEWGFATNTTLYQIKKKSRRPIQSEDAVFQKAKVKLKNHED